MSEWQPIETAPKDGTKILVWTHHDVCEISEWFQATGYKYKEVGRGLYAKSIVVANEGWSSNTPTHWQPLPDPPEAES